MYACISEIGGGFFEVVCPPSNATADSYDPPHPATQRPEPHCQDSGLKRVTRHSTVDGALAWGRGKPPHAHCQSTARMPPTHHAACRTHVPHNIASKCAPRRNPLPWPPRSHVRSSLMSWSRRSSKLWMSCGN